MAGISRSGFQALANAVWSLVAVGLRTVTVATNNDKTGYSINVRVQSNNMAFGSGDTVKNYSLPFSVAAARTFVSHKGSSDGGTGVTAQSNIRLSHSSTTVTGTRVTSGIDATVEFDVVEYT
jgi:hypothetical protein